MGTTRWSHTGTAALLLTGGMLLALETPTLAETKGRESDQTFLQQALGVNELELRLGHLAVDRASTPELKAMGQKMIQKHTEFGQQLSDLAKQSGMSGKAEMSPDQQETFARVESQTGPRFDSTFKQTVDDGHVKELAMYQDEVSRAGDPKLRALAERRVSELQKSMTGGKQSSGAMR